ncbi:hypothetical protein K1719_015866 [Acacia pycnantha]|nr:hypothetical protein K1719_015866 [Acacia pycnantha]
MNLALSDARSVDSPEKLTTTVTTGWAFRTLDGMAGGKFSILDSQVIQRRYQVGLFLLTLLRPHARFLGSSFISSPLLLRIVVPFAMVFLVS